MSTILEPISSQNPKNKQGKQQPDKLFDGFNPLIKSAMNSQSSTVDLNTVDPSCLESSNEDDNSVCINTELSLQQPYYNNLLSPVPAQAGRPGFEPCRRRPIQIRPIEKLSRRQVTFSKRKSSLLRKAQQLSVLCNAEVGLIIISASGKAYHYASSRLDNMLEKYLRFSQRVKDGTPKDIKSLEEVELQLEESMLLLKEKKMELLMKGVTESGSNVPTVCQNQ